MYRCIDEHFYVHGYAPISVDRYDIETIRNGYSKRLCRVLPLPDFALLQELFEYVDVELDRMFPNIPEYIPYEEWRAGLDVNQLRLLQLDAAHARNRGLRPSLKRCHKVKSHIKDECYPKYKNARGINSRVDDFKAWFGPICKTIEHVMYKITHFVKELTPEQRIQRVLALSGKGNYIYSTDFDSFESAFTPYIMACLEFRLYKHFMREDDFNFVRRVIGGRNRMVMRNGFIAECDGRRMSGEMSTSLANSFTNLMLIKFICHKKHLTFDGLVEGDDGLFVLSGPVTNEDYKQLGFTIKIKRELDVNHAAFCGLIVSPANELIKDPRRVFQKFAWSLNCVHSGTKVCKELLRAKAMSLYYELPQCPIIGVIARYAMRTTSGYKPRFERDGYHKLVVIEHVTDFKPHIETRICFEQQFGVSIAVQLQIEEMILSGKEFSTFGDYMCFESPGSVYDRQCFTDMLDYEAKHVYHI
jgi:hypothetical protein